MEEIRTLKCILKCEILPFVAMWMDLENIMMSEISQTDKYCILSLICRVLKIMQMNVYNQTETNSQI